MVRLTSSMPAKELPLSLDLRPLSMRSATFRRNRSFCFTSSPKPRKMSSLLRRVTKPLALLMLMRP